MNKFSVKKRENPNFLKGKKKNIYIYIYLKPVYKKKCLQV
jgi:hypothetical protein